MRTDLNGKQNLTTLREFFGRIVVLQENDWFQLRKRLHYIEFRKGDNILSEGEIENNMYFLIAGVTRIFYSNNGQDYTLRFNFPISSFNSYTSYIRRVKSKVSVEALTDVKAYKISYDDMEELYKEAEQAEKMGRKIIEALYIEREMKELELQTSTAEEIYCKMLLENNKLIQYIPQKHIASYLGIAPESLSRIRKNISQI